MNGRKGRFNLQESQRRQGPIRQQKGAHSRVRSGQTSFQREPTERSRRSPCASPSRLETVQPPPIRKDRYWKDCRGEVCTGKTSSRDLGVRTRGVIRKHENRRNRI